MINKIKDKQTGEYHDIGGLKCKLVAEGELNYRDDIEKYEKVYEFENRKSYYFVLYDSDAFENVKFIANGICSYYTFKTQTGYDWDTDQIIYIEQDGSGLFIYKCLSYSNDEGEYNAHYYRVYELPFVLEV